MTTPRTRVFLHLSLLLTILIGAVVFLGQHTAYADNPPADSPAQLFKCADGKDAVYHWQPDSTDPSKLVSIVKCGDGSAPQEKTSSTNFGGNLKPEEDCSVATRAWLCTDASGKPQNDLFAIVNTVSNFIIGLFAGVSALLILWYIIRIIASAGHPDQISAAKQHLTQVAISLGLLVAAYAIIQLAGIVFK